MTELEEDCAALDEESMALDDETAAPSTTNVANSLICVSPELSVTTATAECVPGSRSLTTT